MISVPVKRDIVGFVKWKLYYVWEDYIGKTSADISMLKKKRKSAWDV